MDYSSADFEKILSEFRVKGCAIFSSLGTICILLTYLFPAGTAWLPAEFGGLFLGMGLASGVFSSERFQKLCADRKLGGNGISWAIKILIGGLIFVLYLKMTDHGSSEPSFRSAVLSGIWYGLLLECVGELFTSRPQNKAMNPTADVERPR